MSNAPTRIFLTWALAIAMTLAGTPAFAQTIVDEWATVKTPPAPELKPVTIGNPKETALLMLDFVKQICSPQARPRCVASLPKVQRLLTQARAKGVQVIYTLAGQSVADIWPEVAPAYGEPSVSSGPDKYIGTDLEKILKEKGIKSEYLHSEIKTLERIKILREFRQGTFDVVVGVNLLREGLDLPEVALIGILDATKRASSAVRPRSSKQ